MHVVTRMSACTWRTSSKMFLTILCYFTFLFRQSSTAYIPSMSSCSIMIPDFWTTFIVFPPQMEAHGIHIKRPTSQEPKTWQLYVPKVISGSFSPKIEFVYIYRQIQFETQPGAIEAIKAPGPGRTKKSSIQVAAPASPIDGLVVRLHFDGTADSEDCRAMQLS